MAEKKEEAQKERRVAPGWMKTFFRKFRKKSYGPAVPRYSGRAAAQNVLDRLGRDSYKGHEKDIIEMLKTKVGNLDTYIEPNYGAISYSHKEGAGWTCWIDQLLNHYKELGPHYDEDVLRIEKSFYGGGTGKKTIKIKFKLPTIGSEEEFKFPIPDIKKVTYPEPDFTVHKMRCLGYRNSMGYGEEYKKEIERLRDWAMGEIENASSTLIDDNLKKRFIDNIKLLCNHAIDLIPEKIKEIGEKERDIHDSYNKYFSRIGEIQSIRKTLDKIRPGEDGKTVRYWHTFRVVKPQILDENNEIKYLKDVVAGRENELIRYEWGEYEFGLDAYGRPLEVNEKGQVLIDIWFNEAIEEYKIKDEISVGAETIKDPEPVTIREFPLDFCRDMDALDVANIMYNEWDEYRDDWRDGRYHPNILLAVDYAAAMNPQLVKKELWKIKDENQLTEKFREYRYKFSSKPTTAGKRYKNDVTYPPKGVEALKRGPSNLTPAFDKRVYLPKTRKFNYVGRKFYWSPVNAVDFTDKYDQKDPTITSRGISMYILNRIRSEVKEIENMVWIHNQIGQKNFDYGPRFFPKPKTGGTMGLSMPFEQRFQFTESKEEE